MRLNKFTGNGLFSERVYHARVESDSEIICAVYKNQKQILKIGITVMNVAWCVGNENKGYVDFHTEWQLVYVSVKVGP